ncbi:hypothetical protein DL89DRAFT_295180 [Linderina pennispora]|uniref:Uncharacterized protein n=1 Tax=Linderina pennispora TaxID=61395 RepID=A0A1Y1VZX1_9FUNG|nr:uncharacterized protein DL89DRAFT_295180 [Linderina pennispora]ORX66811.1 hypothetical protein DL89DRAFT_295180 [Linderina pennispora]
MSTITSVRVGETGASEAPTDDVAGSSMQASAASTQPQTPAADVALMATNRPPSPPPLQMPAVASSSGSSSGSGSGSQIPQIASASGIPMVGSTSSSTQRASGTPIVFGGPKSPQLHPARRLSTLIGSPGSPAMRGRLGTLSSPAMAPLSSPSLQAMVAPSQQQPRKRRRRGRQTSEANAAEDTEKEELQLKTADDYHTLSAESISNLPISYFCGKPTHGVPTRDVFTTEVPRVVTPVPEETAAEPAKKEEDAVKKDDEINPMAAQVQDCGRRNQMGSTENVPLETVDESTNTRLTNSMTYVKKKATRKRWDKEETELFFQALRKFGTDFQMIASMIPNRNRYDIKNKFRAEEKRNGARITAEILQRPVVEAAADPGPQTVEGNRPEPNGLVALSDVSAVVAAAAADVDRIDDYELGVPN